MDSPFELTTKAVRLEAPEDALGALAALRSRLADLEALHVRNARESGVSWRRLGELLGVSKQALHKRYAAQVQPHAAPLFAFDRARAKIIISGRARRAVRFARQEARAWGHRPAGTGHLLLGLLRDADTAPARALRSLGLTLDEARTAVDRAVAPTRRRGAEPEEASVPVSRAARRALEQSLHEALRLGDGYLGPEHILLALLRDEGGVAVILLQDAGHSASDVEARLLEALGGRSEAGRNVRSHA